MAFAEDALLLYLRLCRAWLFPARRYLHGLWRATPTPDTDKIGAGPAFGIWLSLQSIAWRERGSLHATR